MEGYYAKIDDIEDITKKFNTHLTNKLFIYGDEICARAKVLADRLKNSITTPTVNLEKKGIDPIKLDNYANWLFTTNNETAFKIDKDDRRMFMIKCIEVPLNVSYYTDYYDNYINNKLEINKLYIFFKNYNTEKYNDIGKGRVPQTQYKKELEYENTPSYKKVLYVRTKDYEYRKITSASLKEMADEYGKKNYLSNYSVTEFGTEMRKLLEPYRSSEKGSIIYNFKNVSCIDLKKHLYEQDPYYYKMINGLSKDEMPNFEEENED